MIHNKQLTLKGVPNWLKPRVKEMQLNDEIFGKPEPGWAKNISINDWTS